jgi:hypothetical protein
MQDSSFDLLNDRISFFGVSSFGEDGDEESFEGSQQVPLNDAKDKPIKEPDSSSEFPAIFVPFLGTNETHKARSPLQAHLVLQLDYLLQTAVRVN